MRSWFIEQMAMYSAYHRDKRNQATHHIGVPMIVFSLFVVMGLVPLFSMSGTKITLASLFYFGVMGMYLIGIPVVGIIAAVIYGVVLYFALQVVAAGPQFALTVFAVFFVTGWIIQFIGHAFEGRRPALMDNAMQALMAPSFLIAETLFALGFLNEVRGEMDRRMVHYLPTLPRNQNANSSSAF